LPFLSSFSKSISQSYININSEIEFHEDNDAFLIQIYGDEELNKDWIEFLKKYSTDKTNIGKEVVIYLFGIYDFHINLNSTIIYQIKYITRFLSLKIHIYPIKISKHDISVEQMAYFHNHTFLPQKVSDDEKILQEISFNRQKKFYYNRDEVNFISLEDNFSSILNDNSFLERYIKITTVKKIILDRTNLKDFFHFDIENFYIKQLSLVSCQLEKIPNLSMFSTLEKVNFTANYISNFNLKYFSKNMEYINISKNQIDNIEIDREYGNIKRVALFNNRLTSLKNIEFLINLKYLNIGSNPFSNLPLNIFGLKKLEHLNISFLNIKILPEEILNSNIKVLDLTRTKFENSDIIEKIREKGIHIIC
jgi:hypothetical protein